MIKGRITDKDGGFSEYTTTVVVKQQRAPGEFIETPWDKIPNFGANPTITAVQSGPWSDVATWSLGRLPQDGDVVAITPTITVTYDVVSDTVLDTIVVQAGGSLRFRTDVDTRVVVQNFLVLEGGELQVGTPSNPVSPNVTAEIVFPDLPLDLNFDPEQYGNGLIALGKVVMHGATKERTFIRLAAEPKAGDTTLLLSQPATGWQVGDQLYLPDTRQLNWNERGDKYVPQWEYLTISDISADGKTITLSAPLQFDHLGARNPDGVLEFLPHVSNQSRNIRVRSANPHGTRGYVLFTWRADIDVRYVSFSGLGRTTNDKFDNTTFDSTGAVTSIGTNQSGRYPVHLHHLMGPTSAQSNGYQYTFTGNSITCSPDGPMPFRWGLTIHDSHYGLVSDNVLLNWAGAGIVTQDGSESYNVIERNFVARISGNGSRMSAGREGVGYWFRGPNNYVRDNVATNIQDKVYTYGYNLWFRYTGNRRIPAFQGADASVDGQYITKDMNATPILEFARNEVYGAVRNGLSFWWVNAFGNIPNNGGPSTIKDFIVWHQYGWGAFGYQSNDLTIDGFVARGDTALAKSGNGAVGLKFSDYLSRNLTIRNADLQGLKLGISPSTNSGGGSQTIVDSYLRNITNISLSTMWTSSYRSDNLPPRKVVIDNVRFDSLPGKPLIAISMNWVTDADLSRRVVNLVQKDQVFVYNYNGVQGDNFRVYYNEQRADYVVPQTILNSDGTARVTASPEAGLTNQENWDRYGIAIAGEIAPADAGTRNGINGLVKAL